MSLVTRITARLRRAEKRADLDVNGSPVRPDRPMGGSGDDYRDFQSSLDRNRISGGPPMSGF